jgi:hypothetical protein
MLKQLSKERCVPVRSGFIWLSFINVGEIFDHLNDYHIPKAQAP